MEEEYELMIKVILVGDSGVGKTNIMSKYLKDQFMEFSKSTIGVEFNSKTFNHEGHKIKAQIWDTAGQERYKAITSAYYKGAKGAFIVYDITKKSTFESVDNWINDLKSKGDPNLIMIIIGNKNDLEEERKVTKEEGEEKAKSFGCAFLETSALSGDNIEMAFELMVSSVFEKHKKDSNNEEQFGSAIDGKDLNAGKSNNNKKGCC